MSDTPRTDEFWRTYRVPYTHGAEAFARQLERELAEARRQRDKLADAAQAVVDRWDAPTWKELEPTAKLMNSLRKALAAVKGGQYE